MNDAKEIAQRSIVKLSEIQPHRYILRWKGSKIPHGAKVGDDNIQWTQHGEVRGERGQILAYYDRTIEWGGPDGDEHEMVVSSEREVFDTQKRPCMADNGRVGEGVPRGTVALGLFRDLGESP